MDNYPADSSETNSLLPLLFTTKFSSAHKFKNHIELLSVTVLDETCESQMQNFKKETDKTPLNTTEIVY